MRLVDIMPGAVGRRLESVDAASVGTALQTATIAVVGATGAVGLEVLALLVELGVEPARIRAIASASSVGSIVRSGGRDHEIRGLGEALEAEVAILATPAEVSRRIAPELIDAGVLVSDNSSAFRDEAPLIIPEWNPEAVRRGDRLVASPNCTTTIAVTGIAPLLATRPPISLEIVSYQAISGAGMPALHAILEESRDLLAGDAPSPRWRHHPVAFNAFPHESSLDPVSGACGEERKFVQEAGRLLRLPSASLAATCLRIPVLRTHTVAVRLRLPEACSVEMVRTRLASAPGVRLVEDGPTSHQATARAGVLVGRIRVESSTEGAGSLVRAVVAGDQLLKGAAWNALQNAALLVSATGCSRRR